MLSNKKVQIVLLVLVILGVGGALHFLVYAPLQQQWNDISAEQKKLGQEYSRILGVTGSSTKVGDLPSTVSAATEKVKERLTEMDNSLTKLTDTQTGLELVEHYDSSLPEDDFIREVLDGVQKVKEVEKGSTVTKMAVSSQWGVDFTLGEGKFGTGFSAREKRVRVYPNFRGAGVLQRVLIETGGTVEFFFRPDWDPNDAEMSSKMKLLFLALGRQTVSTIEELRAISPERAAAMVAQKPPYVLECVLAIYKGQGPTLVFEMRDYKGRPSRLTAMITDWKPKQWYHIAGVWGKNQQALYINGSNRGNPIMGPSIRDKEDTDYLDDLAPGAGGGMGGFGMYGMGMGMMGMGMMGMGMGGMGMGMGGMGMGMGGMYGMGGMGRGGSGAVMGGITLTQGVATPSDLMALYVGCDEKGGYSADGDIDDLRVSSGVRIPSSAGLDQPRQRMEDTLLLEPFDNEYPDPTTIVLLLNALRTRQTLMTGGGTSAAIQEQKKWEYDVFRKALGIDKDLLDDPKTDPTARTIRKVITVDYILQCDKNLTRAELLKFLDIQLEPIDKLYSVARFLVMARDICQRAIDCEVTQLKAITYKGQGYTVSDDELRAAFQTAMTDLQINIYGSEGGMGGMGMGMGGMGMYGGMGMMPGMGMGMMPGMGMGMMGMGMMGGSMMQSMYNPDRFEDPVTGELYTGQKLMEVMKEIQEDQKKLAAWRKMDREGKIPEEVIESYNQQKLAAGENYYIKRSSTVDYLSDFKSFCRFIHSLEFGNKLYTINRLGIKSEPDDVLDVSMDVESHHVETPEQAKEQVEGGIASAQ